MFAATELLPARYQMALSLGFHIVLSCFGVAFPALIYVVHRRGLRRNDEDALTLARRWSKVAAVLFAVGAVSGTILSFEMGLLWPGMMSRFGDVIGLPFALEGSTEGEIAGEHDRHPQHSGADALRRPPLLHE